MSGSSTLIQSPYTIAHLPRPLDTINGKTYASDVYKIVGSRKRKRNEIITATDGEGVNIYDVQSPRLQISHALSPQSTFTCAPCCVCFKPSKSQPTRSLTYCSVYDTNPRIHLFFGAYEAASVQRPPPPAGPKTNPPTFPIPKSSPVVYIDVIPSGSNTEAVGEVVSLLVVHKDGQLRCLSGDLLAQRWSSSIASLMPTGDAGQTSSMGLQVEYSVLVDTNTAGKGLLRERADLQAMLSVDTSTTSAKVNRTVLCLVTSSKNAAAASVQNLRFHMFAIHTDQASSTSNLFNNATPSVLHMQSANLPPFPDPVSASQPTTRIFLRASSATLYSSLDDKMIIYDLSGTVPKISTYIDLHQHGLSTFLRLSSSSILVTSSGSATIYDTKYKSIRATVPIGNDGASEAKSTSRKADRPPIRLLSYLSNLGLAIAVSENHDLLAFQLGPPGSSHSSQLKRGRDGRLIDSLGRGILHSKPSTGGSDGYGSSFGDPLPSRHLNDQRWQEILEKLDKYVAQERVDLFDDIMAGELGIGEEELTAGGPSEGLEKPSKKRRKGPNSFRSDSQPGQRLGSCAPRNAPVNMRKICYVLGKMFSVTDVERRPGRLPAIGPDTGSGLKVMFFPPKTFKWLAKTGNISTTHVELALRRTECCTNVPMLRKGALMEAILAHDPSLENFMILFEGAVYVDAVELAHVIQLLLHTMESKEQRSAKLLTNGEEISINGTGDSIEDLHEVNVLTTDDDKPLIYEKQSATHRRALFAALHKLYRFPASTITTALRKGIPGADVVRLIHQLRIELAEGGWTSHYVDGGYSPETDRLDHESLLMVSTLLNCAIDAIGMGGWVSGALALDDPEEREDMIEYMRSEVSVVLEGTLEAAYLTAMLAGLLLYGKSVAARPHSSSTTNNNAGITSKPTTIQSDTAGSCLLPLSLKAPQNISLTKIGVGGEIKKRSHRDIGRLKSKMIGKYTHERIII